MRKFMLMISVAVFCFSLQALYARDEPEGSAKKTEAVKIDNTKMSIALGQQIGNSLKKLQDQMKEIGMPLIEVDSFIKGLKSCLSEKGPLLDEAEANKVRTEFFGEMRKKSDAQRKIADAQRKIAGEKSLKEGKDFLAENKKKEGIIVTASGLQYKVIKEGSGKKALKENTVTVNYRGTLLNGKEFDSSYKRGKPSSFQVGRVIKGWQEALCLMSVGSKYKLFIPADIAYGTRGSGANIPPNSVLIFEVELLEITETPKRTPRPSRSSRPQIKRVNKPAKSGKYGPPPPPKKK